MVIVILMGIKLKRVGMNTNLQILDHKAINDLIIPRLIDAHEMQKTEILSNKVEVPQFITETFYFYFRF
jgi:hypothetical protein